MAGNLTIDKRSTKSVQARTTGNEKTRFTCVLKTIQNHHRLVFLKVNDAKKFYLALMHPKGWMDEIGMKDWLSLAWDPIKKNVQDENTNLAITPGGLTYVIQPLVKSIFGHFGRFLLHLRRIIEQRDGILWFRWISKIGFNENIEEWWKITSRIEKLQQANRRFGFTIMTNGTSVSVNLKRVIIHNVMNFSTKEWYSQVGFTR
nr:6681_t:CDS:2 [Entrophospora candida]